MRTVSVVHGCPELATRDSRCARHQLRRSERLWRRLVEQVLERDHGVCGLCGRPGAMSADHIVRVVDGGTDELENLRACHVTCNQRRG
jgi:5-methylcytosine-specific restriction endonuclease McrA